MFLSVHDFTRFLRLQTLGCFLPWPSASWYPCLCVLPSVWVWVGPKICFCPMDYGKGVRIFVITCMWLHKVITPLWWRLSLSLHFFFEEASYHESYSHKEINSSNKWRATGNGSCSRQASGENQALANTLTAICEFLSREELSQAMPRFLITETVR